MSKKALLIGGISTAVIAVAVAIVLIFTGNADDYRSIKVFEVNGTCTVTRDGSELNAFRDMSLESGDTFTVGDSAYARLKLDSDKYVYLESGTKIELYATGTQNNSKTRVYIERGSMMTEVRKKLSATSTYDIVTPNTSMAIRGTKVLTQVFEDYVTGQIRTCNAILEGLVNIKGVKMKADGTVVAIERDLGPGESVAFNTDKDELVSAEDMKSMADSGKTADGITVEIVSEEEAGAGFETPSEDGDRFRASLFEKTFLENIKQILIDEAKNSSESGELSDEDDAWNGSDFSAIMNAYDRICGMYNEGGSTTTDGSDMSDEGSETPIEGAGTAGILSSGSEPSAADNTGSFEIESSDTDPDKTVVEADDREENDDSDISESEETENEETDVEGDEKTDTETGSIDNDEKNNNDADQTGDTGSTGDAGNNGNADKTGDSGSGNNGGSGNNNDGDKTGGADTGSQGGSLGDGETTQPSGDTGSGSGSGTGSGSGSDSGSGSGTGSGSGSGSGSGNGSGSGTGSGSGNGSGTGTGSGSGSGTGSGSGGNAQTTTTKPVTYTTQRVYSGTQSGSSQPGTTVNLAFYNGSAMIPASDLPQEFGVDEWLPGMGSGNTYSVLVEEQYRDAYSFTGWYTTQAAANTSDSAFRVEKMPSSSGERVELFAGIKKKAMTVEITNLFPTAGRIYIPTGGTDDDGHVYEVNDNRVIISGYEYGDSFELPEEYGIASANAGLASGTLDKTAYIDAVDRSVSTYFSPFICYSTSGDLNISRIMTLDTVPEDYNGSRIFLNKNAGTSPTGNGVESSITLDKNTTENGTLKLYAYFAEEIRATVKDAFVELSDQGSVNYWNRQTFANNGAGALEFTGNATEKDRQWWYCSTTADEIVLKTWFQGNKAVDIPKFALASDGRTSNDSQAIQSTYGAGLGQRPYLNDGSVAINSGFAYYGDGIPQAIDIYACKLDYLLLDLSSSGLDWTNNDINSFGLTNPYYIPEAGDSTSHKYKIALTSFALDGNSNLIEGPGADLPDKNIYYYEDPRILTSQFGSASEEVRYYVVVPDDTFYPWGLIGQTRDLSNGLADAVGTNHKDRNMYIGKTGRKLIGYTFIYHTINQQASDPPRYYDALYWNELKGPALHISVPEDGTLILYDAVKTTTPVGTLMSIGNDDSPLLDQRTGQLVMQPLFGPATDVFTVGIIYKYENGTYNPYLRIGGIEAEDIGYVSAIDLSGYTNTSVNAQVYQFGGTSGIQNVDFSRLEFDYRSNRFVPTRLLSDLGPDADYSMCGDMVEGSDGKYHQDIPIVHALQYPTVGSGSGDQYYVRGFNKDYFNAPLTSPAAVMYEICYLDLLDTQKDAFLMNSNYAPCAVKVFVPENEYYRYTGISGSSGKLPFVFDEREYTFENVAVAAYLQEEGARYGGELSGRYSDTVHNYAYAESDGTATDYDTPMIFSYATSGNAQSALHGGNDQKRYAGLLEFTDYKTVYITNPDNVTFIEASASDYYENGVLHTNNTTTMTIDSTEISVNVMQNGTYKAYIISPAEAQILDDVPPEYMLVRKSYAGVSDVGYWMKVDLDGENPAAGEAVVTFSTSTN